MARMYWEVTSHDVVSLEGNASVMIGKESILSCSSEWSRGLGPTRLGERVVRLINETLVAALNHIFAIFVFCTRSEDRFQDSASFFLFVLFVGCCCLRYFQVNRAFHFCTLPLSVCCPRTKWANGRGPFPPCP
jgi:hypothetical protein